MKPRKKTIRILNQETGKSEPSAMDAPPGLPAMQELAPHAQENASAEQDVCPPDELQAAIPEAPAAQPESSESTLSAAPAQEAPAEAQTAPQEPSSPTPPIPVPQAISAPAPVTRAQALWLAAVCSLLTLCLASVLIVTFLGSLNGGLRYARPAQVQAAQVRLEGLSAQAAAMQAELDELSARLEALEGLDSRVASVEREMEQTRRQVDQATARVDAFQQQVDQLSLQVDVLATRASRFQAFLDGLEDLLNKLTELIP